MPMKTTIIITIIVCLALAPFMFGNITPYKLNIEQIENAIQSLENNDEKATDKHKLGLEQGDGNAIPLDNINTNTNTSNAEITNDGLGKEDIPMEKRDFTIYPIVVFIVSLNETEEVNGLCSTAIVCYTMPIGDGNYVWRGGNGSWSDFSSMYFTVQAAGNKDGITFIKATEYLFGEKTDTPVYIRDIVGLSNLNNNIK